MEIRCTSTRTIDFYNIAKLNVFMANKQYRDPSSIKADNCNLFYRLYIKILWTIKFKLTTERNVAERIVQISQVFIGNFIMELFFLCTYFGKHALVADSPNHSQEQFIFQSFLFFFCDINQAKYIKGFRNATENNLNIQYTK